MSGVHDFSSASVFRSARYALECALTLHAYLTCMTARVRYAQHSLLACTASKASTTRGNIVCHALMHINTCSTQIQHIYPIIHSSPLEQAISRVVLPPCSLPQGLHSGLARLPPWCTCPFWLGDSNYCRWGRGDRAEAVGSRLDLHFLPNLLTDKPGQHFVAGRIHLTQHNVTCFRYSLAPKVSR